MNIWIAGKDSMKHYYHPKTLFTLNLENITDEDYKHTQKVWDT